MRDRGAALAVGALLLTVVTAVSVLAGVTAPDSGEVAEPAPGEVAEPAPGDMTAPAPAGPRPMVEVTVYFADPRGMGLVGLPRRVPAGRAAEGIVRALIAGPQPGEAAVAPLPPGARLLGVAVDDGLAIVNFSRELRDRFGGGSAGETILVYSLVNSLTSLPNVRAVSLEVEGEPLSTLGHLDLTGPLPRRPALTGAP